MDPKDDIRESVLGLTLELNTLAEKRGLERTRATALLVASVIFIILGVYGLVFSAIYDLTLLPLMALSLASIATGLGILFEQRFGLWLALVLFPLGMVLVSSALYYSVTVFGWYPNDAVTAFNVSLVFYAIGLVVSLLLVVDRRSLLK